MKSNLKSSLYSGSFIVLLIILSPYLLYIHNTIPPELESYETIFGITIQGGHYEKVEGYLYWFFDKFTPLLLLVIWFLTNKHWWVHALIIPISVYLFQLISVVNDGNEFVAVMEFIYTVPVTLISVVILYFVRSKIAIYIQAVDLKKEMDQNMNVNKKIA